MAEEAKKIRATAKSRFTRKQEELLKSENKGIDTVKRTFAELNEAWSLVNTMLGMVDRECVWCKGTFPLKAAKDH